MWQCPKCKREFKNTSQDHYCGKTETIDHYIAEYPDAVQGNSKIYEYEAVIQPADEGKDAAFIIFPYDIREEFGKGKVNVHATFDGEPYAGSVVNMGVKNADGSVCYIIGIRKDIRAKIRKQVGDTVNMTIRERT